jgi:hypothetical protein
VGAIVTKDRITSIDLFLEIRVKIMTVNLRIATPTNLSYLLTPLIKNTTPTADTKAVIPS